MIFHYSRAVFEGQKAYRSTEDGILLFRPCEQARRMNQSLSRMDMPSIPEDVFVQAECELLKVEECWIPRHKGASLYIRPVAIATEALLGAVRPSETYLFFIILSPAGFFFKEGFSPIRLMVERNYTRAATDGTV